MCDEPSCHIKIEFKEIVYTKKNHILWLFIHVISNLYTATFLFKTKREQQPKLCAIPFTKLPYDFYL